VAALSKLGWAAIILQLLIVLVFLLPDAGSEGTGSITIPSAIWDPLVAVLHLNRLLPISALLIGFATVLTVRAAMFFFWIGTYILGWFK
jgi:hypothetical protein